QRAAGYDERNEFPYQDIEVLQQAGYFSALTDVSDGGLGWNFAALVDAQKKLAAYSPATALAVNMHQVWSAVASIFSTHGNRDLEFILKYAAAIEIYAFAISEYGNDADLLVSCTVAVELCVVPVLYSIDIIFDQISLISIILVVFEKSPEGVELIFRLLDQKEGNTLALA